MDEFSKKRAEKLGDNRFWTPMDSLEDTIERIKGLDPKKVMMVTHWWEVQDDGTRIHHYSAANLTTPEHISILEVSKLRLVTWWCGK